MPIQKTTTHITFCIYYFFKFESVKALLFCSDNGYFALSGATRCHAHCPPLNMFTFHRKGHLKWIALLFSLKDKKLSMLTFKFTLPTTATSRLPVTPSIFSDHNLVCLYIHIHILLSCPALIPPCTSQARQSTRP